MVLALVFEEAPHDPLFKFTEPGDSICIGRDKHACKIVLPPNAPGVSRMHLQLTHKQIGGKEVLCAVDKSKFGTEYNGKGLVIEKEKEITDGTTITIGPYNFLVKKVFEPTPIAKEEPAKSLKRTLTTEDCPNPKRQKLNAERRESEEIQGVNGPTDMPRNSRARASVAKEKNIKKEVEEEDDIFVIEEIDEHENGLEQRVAVESDSQRINLRSSIQETLCCRTQGKQSEAVDEVVADTCDQDSFPSRSNIPYSSPRRATVSSESIYKNSVADRQVADVRKPGAPRRGRLPKSDKSAVNQRGTLSTLTSWLERGASQSSVTVTRRSKDNNDLFAQTMSQGNTQKTRTKRAELESDVNVEFSSITKRIKIEAAETEATVEEEVRQPTESSENAVENNGDSDECCEEEPELDLDTLRTKLEKAVRFENLQKVKAGDEIRANYSVEGPSYKRFKKAPQGCYNSIFNEETASMTLMRPIVGGECLVDYRKIRF